MCACVKSCLKQHKYRNRETDRKKQHKESGVCFERPGSCGAAQQIKYELLPNRSIVDRLYRDSNFMALNALNLVRLLQGRLARLNVSYGLARQRKGTFPRNGRYPWIFNGLDEG